jgi:hypothetical protein
VVGQSLSNLEDAELLVYLVDEEMDIYIGVHRTPPRTCPAEHSPAESLSYLGVAESIRIYATATAPPHYWSAGLTVLQGQLACLT